MFKFKRRTLSSTRYVYVCASSGSAAAVVSVCSSPPASSTASSISGIGYRKIAAHPVSLPNSVDVSALRVWIWYVLQKRASY